MVNHRLKQPDWLSLYPRDTDESLLTDIVLSHARDRLAELRVSDAATDSAPMELVRFDDVEDVVVNGAPPIPPIDEDAPTEALVTTVHQHLDRLTTDNRVQSITNLSQ